MGAWSGGEHRRGHDREFQGEFASVVLLRGQHPEIRDSVIRIQVEPNIQIRRLGHIRNMRIIGSLLHDIHAEYECGRLRIPLFHHSKP